MGTSLEKKRITFIAHWVEDWNWLWWCGVDIVNLSKRQTHLQWLWPLYSGASLFYFAGPKSFDVVDKFSFNISIDCQTLLLRNFAWHFLVLRNRERIRERLIKAVLHAQEESHVIGLGALTKAEWLTRGGEWIVGHLGDKLRVPIVHGDTLTAAVIFKQAQFLLERFGEGPVFITGATSKIGRALVLSLVRQQIPVRMFTQSKQRFEVICSEAKGYERFISRADSLNDGMSCALWITGKAIPSGRELIERVGEGIPILNFSVPNPIDSKTQKNYPELRVFEGGLLAYDPAEVDIKHTMRLPLGLTYSCHAGTMVHAYMDWTHHETGPVNINDMGITLDAAEKLGFSVPSLEGITKWR